MVSGRITHPFSEHSHSSIFIHSTNIGGEAVDRNALEFRLGVRRLGLNPGWVTCWDGSFFVSPGLGEVIQSHTNLGVSVKVFHRCG